MSEHSLTSGLRSEALHDPRRVRVRLGPAVAQPVVQPALAALPELHRAGLDPEPAPERRQGYVVQLGELGEHAAVPLVERGPARDHPGLRRRPRPELRLARTTAEVLLALLLRDARRRPDDPDLALDV